MPINIYRYILDTTVRRQLPICVLTVFVVLLTMAPLELQRRIMNNALGAKSTTLLATLGGLYLATLAVQGVLKYILNLSRGRLVEDTTRRLREAIYSRIGPMLAAACQRRSKNASAGRGKNASDEHGGRPPIGGLPAFGGQTSGLVAGGVGCWRDTRFLLCLSL